MPSELSAAGMVLSMMYLSKALLLNGGFFSMEAVEALTASLLTALVSLMSLVVRLPRWVLAIDVRLFRGAAFLALGWQLSHLLERLPGKYTRHLPDDWNTFQKWVLAAALVSGVALIKTRGAAVLWIALFLLMGNWVISHSPHPHIDVYYFQTDSAQALLQGHNPYAITFRDIYSAKDSALFYGPNVSVEGRLQFGFPYLPASLLAATLGHLLANDVRYVHVCAVALAALLMLWGGKHRFWTPLGVALFLFLPTGMHVIEQSWTEPLLMLALTALIFLGSRQSRWAWIPLGLLLCLKQYVVLVVPLLVFFLPESSRKKQLGYAFLLAAAVTAPFFLASPRDFIHSVLELHQTQPFRPESLSYLAWRHAQGYAPWSPALGFVACGLWSIVAWFRPPQTVAATAVWLALALLYFFAFNKQAFANYYYWVFGVLACGLSFGFEDEKLADSAAPQPSSPN